MVIRFEFRWYRYIENSAIRIRSIDRAVKVYCYMHLPQAVPLCDEPVVVVVRHTLQLFTPTGFPVGRIIGDVFEKR